MKTLKSQLQVLIVSFSIIALVIVFAGFIHNNRKDAIRNSINKLSEIEILIFKDMEAVNSFLLYDVINESFYKTGKSDNIITHKALLTQIMNNKSTLEQYTDFDIETEIKLLFEKILLLDQKFAKLRALQLERGFKDYGIEGKMREDIHWVEANKSISQIELLSLRRHEKDYIIRQQKKYVSEHKKLINNILGKLPKSTKAYHHLEAYHAKFIKLVQLDEEIGKSGHQGITKEIKQIHDQTASLLNQIISSGQQKQDLMIKSYNYNYISFAVIFILASILIGLYISHRLSKQLHRLSLGISDFVSSNFTKIPEISHKGDKSEIHILTQNFLILRDEILTYIKNFEEKVREQTKTLTFQNLQIEDKNKKILAQKQKLVEQFDTIFAQKERVTAQKKRLLESIRYAKHIQGALLPNEQTINNIYRNNFVLYKPKDIISGDFYWIKKIETSTESLTITIVADCTGHGVPGALLSMLGISYLNDIIINQRVYRPDIVLNKLRDYFINTLQQMENQHTINDGLDISVCVIDNNSNTMNFAGANRNLYLIRNNQLTIVSGNRMPIGKHGNDLLVPFTCTKTKLHDHDNIYLFTDGFEDQFGGENDIKFMRQRFRKLLLSVQNESFGNQKAIISRHFNIWKGSNYQVDDVLLIGFEFKQKVNVLDNKNKLINTNWQISEAALA